jgi:FkbM family methyltransferase
MLTPKSLVRGAIQRAGYWLAHRSVLPFGVDPVWDIRRLAARRGEAVRCVFDIGAHTGETARAYLAAFPEAAVHAFEPHPNSFACVAQLKSERLHAHRLAASNRCGEAEFFVFSELADDPDAPIAASMNNSLVAETQFGLVAGRNPTSITVDCVTVDSFCADQGLERLDLLKIDTEGHEREVLEGASETLARRGVKFVFLEFETLRPIAGANGGALAPCAELLEPLGFRLVATYPNYMIDRPLYASLNALFVAPIAAERTTSAPAPRATA